MVVQVLGVPWSAAVEDSESRSEVRKKSMISIFLILFFVWF